MKNPLLSAAYQYIENGICVMPTNKDKIPCISWAEWQTRMITKEEAKEGFSLPYADYIGVICGRSSGNLEVIDIDVKYDRTGQLFENYLKDIHDNDEALLSSLLINKTRSGGYHLYYRCDNIEGNQQLAQRYSTEDELRTDPKDKIKVLLETRGIGGYVVAPPSPGYEKYSGQKIPNITTDQREILLTLARTYNQVIIEQKKEYSVPLKEAKGFFTTPWDDYNLNGAKHCIELLKNHGWNIIKDTGPRIQFRRPGKSVGISADYHKELRLFKVFTTSSEFEVGHGYTHYGVFKLLACGNDPHEAGRKLAEKWGEKRINYGKSLERSVFKKKQEGLDDNELVKFIENNYDDHKATAAEIVTNLSKLWGEKLCTFWDVDDKNNPSINRGRLIDFLYQHGGFALFYYDKNSTIFRVVQCKDGFLQEASSEYMKKFILEYLDSLPDTFDGGITPDDIKDLILKSHDRLFNNGLLEFLPRGDYNLLKDTIDTAYFPFLNGVVKITKDGVSLMTYHEVSRVVWKSQIIDFEIKIDPDITQKTIEYFKFLECVCNDDEDKLNYAVTLIGYLLHKYKDPAKPYCVILAEENDNENKGGGTGKGIFLTALSKLVNTERVDGKNFKLDKNFAFQRVGLDTKLIAIEDTRKNVDFEGFYSIITEGITVEKKNKDELFIPYRDSPKIVFTTNYTIINSGAHARRRQKTFEFSPYFGAEKTPVHVFGHNLFDDWAQLEWNLFYNLMFHCCKDYLDVGILEKESTIKVRRKHIRLKYGEEFIEWFDDWVKNGAYEWSKFIAVYDEFLVSTGTEKKFFSSKRFSNGIHDAVDMILENGHIVEKKRVSGLNRGIELKLAKPKAVIKNENP